MRSAGVAASPAIRARTVQENLVSLIQRGGPLEVTTERLPEGIAVIVDQTLVFRVLKEDTNPELGEDVQLLADAAVHNLRTALAEMHELRDSRGLLKAIGYALLATMAFAGLMWALWRGHAALARRIRDFVTQPGRAAVLGLGPSRGGPGRARPTSRPCRCGCWRGRLTLLLLYEWADLVLGFFPYTRPWGEALLGHLLRRARQLRSSAMLDAMPGLLFVVLIFFVTRFVVRVMRVFFEGVQAGPDRGRLGGRGDGAPDRAAAHGHHLAVRAGGGLSLPAGQRQRGLQGHRRVRRPDAVDRRVRHRQPGGERADADVHARAAAGRVRADRRDRGHGDRRSAS